MANVYKHILLAVDFSPKTEELVRKAIRIAKELNAKITLLHAHERDVAASHLFVDENEYEKLIHEKAVDRLSAFVDKNEIPESNWLIEIATPKQAIIDTATKLKCDLIILGSHGRHGLQRILGSTANAVLNVADRDVHIIWYRD